MGQARDPLRWIDDPAIDPSLRDAVRAARDVAPSFDPVLGLARLESGIRAGAAGASASTLATTGALALLLIAGLSSWPDRALLESSPDSVPRNSVPRASAPPAPNGAPHEALATTTDALSPRDEPSSAAITSAALLEAPSDAHVEDDRARAPHRARDGSPDGTLALELAQLSDARRTLSSDPARALALLEEGRERYPSSVVGEERDALRVLALIALHRDGDARVAGERFLAAHPTSPFAERMRRALERPGASMP